jgi:hypothetical protein
MESQGLPPQFLYLGLQESSFNEKACGPPTRFGIAKGMWQFIPTTARNYGLRTGPMAELAQFDPEDERHDFQKSTRAAAEYIRYIYDTQAQASGLLVMASYNWGEHRVIKLINTMPENPRERNFWCLLSKYRPNIPQETYDYVFYIISAAVLKTHGYASVTLSLKNMLLGAPINDYTTSDKSQMHRGPHGEPDDLIHFNMFHMAQEVWPDVAVIDGFTGMEGDGPSRGTPVDSRIAVSSVDPLAADVLSARLMGFDSKKILYLSAMTEAGMGQGNLERIDVLGNRVEECSYRFKNSPLLHFSAAVEA